MGLRSKGKTSNLIIYAYKAMLLKQGFYSLTNDKISDLSKFKAFADDKIISTQKWKFVLGRVENMEGKGENAGHQHFLLFLQSFLKLSFPEVFNPLPHNATF